MIYLEHKDNDAYFKSCTGTKILLSDIKSESSDLAIVRDTLITVYTEVNFENVPQCDCGAVKAAYRDGKYCKECGTKVTDPFKKKDPILWFKAYPELPKFLNQHFWLQMRELLGKKVDILRYISDTQYNPPGFPKWVDVMLQDLNINRSYTDLVNNIDRILIYCINTSMFKTNDKSSKLEKLLEIYNRDKNKLYSEFLPVLNKRLFVMEKNKMGSFIDLSVGNVMDVVYSYILNNTDASDKRKKSNVMARIISGLADIEENFSIKFLGSKEGEYRKHISGAKTSFSFRTVISSIYTEHTRDEIYVPWIVGVTAFRPHILNILVNRYKMKYKEASLMLFNHTEKYHSLLDEILQTLIRESKYGGIPLLYGRNPTLPMGSIQFKLITKFKTDAKDKTTSIPILATDKWNADLTYRSLYK